MPQKLQQSQILGFPIKRQSNTTNTTLDNPRIEVGWGWMQFSSSNTNIAEGVTFSTAFSAAPIVLVTMGGDAGNVAANYGTGGNTIHGHTGAKAYNITATGFQAYVWGGTYTSGQTVYYQWMAIGE